MQEEMNVDQIRMGALIARLRREKRLTQVQLAEQMHISDKTISKWERGKGCPDVSLLPELSRILEVDLEGLLSGRLDANTMWGRDMKRMNFYLCPDCGNLIMALADASVSCCGKRLRAVQPQKAPEEERLTVERIENDFYITADHPMEKAHFISFVALATGDSLLLRRQFPEWELQTRIPAFAHGRLLWNCTRHGLFYQEI